MFIKKRSPTWKCDSNCINVLQERWFPNLEVRLHLRKSFSFSSESFSQTALVVEVGLQSRLQLRDLHFERVLCRLKTRPLIFPRAVCYVFSPTMYFRSRSTSKAEFRSFSLLSLQNKHQHQNQFRPGEKIVTSGWHYPFPSLWSSLWLGGGTACRKQKRCSFPQR